MSNVTRLPTSADALRGARYSICAALVTGGPPAALAAVAASSIRLAHHVANGNLLWASALKMLLQVSCNLKLPIIFGRRAVHIAINAGPNLYDQFAEAA